MAIDDDIAKAKKLGLLTSKIEDLKTQIENAKKSFEQKKPQLVKEKDEELKRLFMDGLNHPEIKVVSKGNVITGKGDNLLYTLTISDEERSLSRKLDRIENAYKFRYTFSFPEPFFMDLTGQKTVEDAKNKEIGLLETYLNLCTSALEELETEGIQINYLQMDHGEILTNMTQTQLDDFDAQRYTKTDIKGLLELIGL